VPGGRFAINPLVVDDVMYVVGKKNSIVALDAATGTEIWTHSGRRRPHQSRLQLLGE
jgi:glucose dehydrogenase